MHLELQKAYQREFRIEQLIKKKGDKLHVTWKAYDNSLSSWINNKKYHYISYIVIAEAKFEIKKKTTGADASEFAKKVDIFSLKHEKGKLDIGQSKTGQTDLIKLSVVVGNDAVKILNMINWLQKSMLSIDFLAQYLVKN